MRLIKLDKVWTWICGLYGERLQGERGIALISVILLIMVLTFVSAATIVTSTTELKIGGNFKTSVQAFYIAEAGLQHAKAELTNQLSTLGKTPTQILGANKNTSTSLMLDSRNIASISAAPANSLFPKFVYNSSFSGGSYHVYVTNDQAEGVTSTTDTNNKLTLTSVGYGPNGTMAVVQAVYSITITNPFPKQTSMPGAVSMLGNNLDFNFGNSNDSINGGTVADIAASTKAGIKLPKNGTPQVVSPNPPFDTPLHLHDYYNQLKGVASVAHNFYNASNPIIPSLANPGGAPIVVNGDLTLKTSGSGILVVTGTLSIGTNVNWDGLILVLGTGNLQRGNNGNINGAIVVGSIVGNIDTGAGITGAWGTSTLGGTNGGGHATWTYDPDKWKNTTQTSSGGTIVTKNAWKQF